jgi:hypothetical protein
MYIYIHLERERNIKSNAIDVALNECWRIRCVLFVVIEIKREMFCELSSIDSLMARNSILKTDKWDDWNSNSTLCIAYIMQYPTNS